RPAKRGSLTDPYLRLYRGPASAPILVTTDDDGGPGFDSLIYRWSITTTDTYYVAGGALATVGNYELGVYLENAGAAPLTGGSLTTETEPNDTAATANDASASWRHIQYVSTTAGQTASGDSDLFGYPFSAGNLVSIDAAS